MRGRKSSRSAAVVLAGCVGLAVMAPGLALAAPAVGPASNGDCQDSTTSYYDAGKPYYDTVSGTCVATNPSTTTTTTAPSTGPTTGGGTASTTGGSTTDGSTSNGGSTTSGSSTTPSASSTAPSGSGAAESPAAVTSASSTPSAAALREVTPALQTQADQALADLDIPVVGDLIPLPDLPDIPQPDADGNFANINEACLNAVGTLQFPTGTEGLPDLSEQLQGFCAQLDPTTLTDLVDQLLELIKGLIPSLPTTPAATIPTTPPSTVPAYYHGYWYRQYDVDCGDVTYEEANALLAADPTDPFDLDGDDDGVACEDNARVSDATYIGYPVGGVSTGDGSTGAEVSPAALALAGAGVGGLALFGLTLVRRFGRES